MPVFHNQVYAVGGAPPSWHPDLLQRDGAYVQVQLEAPPALISALAAAGKPAPTPVTGKALLDTGASVSCVDRAVPSKLAVMPVGTTHLTGATGGSPSAMYPMRVLVLGMNWPIDYPFMVEADLAPLGYVALLGRDLLRLATLHYNGIVGEFTISV